MYILLPPSEGKARAGSGPPVDRELKVFAGKILKHTKALSPKDRSRFLSCNKDEKAKEIFTLNERALKAPTLPALERYTGVVFQHLDYGSLKSKAAARKRILVVSAYFGLVSGGTPLPDYKLSMNPWLAKFWQDINTERLEALATGKPVLNLLSQSYAKAIAYEPSITVDFKVAGGKKSAGHFRKAIKGRFARYLIENKVASVEGFAGFEEDGYRFDGENFVKK